jgi:hypothetical protein
MSLYLVSILCTLARFERIDEPSLADNPSQRSQQINIRKHSPLYGSAAMDCIIVNMKKLLLALILFCCVLPIASQAQVIVNVDHPHHHHHHHRR